MLVGIALAVVCKLNKALVILFANISIPPMIPIILFLSHITGAWWMGSNAQHISFTKDITFDTLKDSLVQYYAGGATLAVLAGAASMLITWVLLKIFRRR